MSWKRILKEKLGDTGLGKGLKLRKVGFELVSLVEQMLNMGMILLGSGALPGLVIQRSESEKEKFKLDTVSKGKLTEHIKNAS